MAHACVSHRLLVGRGYVFSFFNFLWKAWYDERPRILESWLKISWNPLPQCMIQHRNSPNTLSVRNPIKLVFVFLMKTTLKILFIYMLSTSSHPKSFLFWFPYSVDTFRICTVFLLGKPAMDIIKPQWKNKQNVRHFICTETWLESQQLVLTPG